ncbi:hypothetical protein Tco_0276670 [Tanacetum coccineum]
MQTLANLTPEEKTRMRCDIKVANNILQGIPNDIYTFLNHMTKAYDIWYRARELMEGTKLTKQERESKMEQVCNRHFKQARNLHEVSFDQLYGYLKQNEADASEVRDVRARFLDPLALIANTYNPPPSYSNGLEGFDSDYEELQLNSTSIFITDHVDAFDSECDEALIACAIFMARLSRVGLVNEDDVDPSYDIDILFEVPNYENYHDNDMFHTFVRELENSKQLVSITDTNVELLNDSNIISDIPYVNINENEVVQDMTSLAQTDAIICL